MASRFLSRCTRLLAICPQASSSASRLHTLTTHPLTEYPPWSQSLILPSIRHVSLAAGPVQADEPNITFTRTELDIRVEKATTPQEVLSLWAEQGGSANQAGMCLVQLSRLAVEKKDIDRANILQDPRCADLLEALNSQVSDGTERCALKQQCVNAKAVSLPSTSWDSDIHLGRHFIDRSGIRRYFYMGWRDKKKNKWNKTSNCIQSGYTLLFLFLPHIYNMLYL